MSSTTTTPNYGLLKPNVGADNDLWGDHINSDLDTLDTIIKTVENKAGVVSFNGRANVVSLTNADVVTVLPGSSAAPLMDGTASAGLATTWSKSDHQHPTDTTRAAASAVPSPSATAPTMNSVADAGVAVAYSRGDHTHPVDTSRYAASNPSGYQTAAQVTTALLPYAPLASPALTGSPTVPTVTPSTDSSTKIASTAFVQSALGAVPGGAVIAATPPALNPGGLWWDSTGGQLYVRYDDGNTQQFVATTNLTGLANAATQTDVAMAQNNVGRNKLHNGLFTINQRGLGGYGANTTGWTYSLDRWMLILAAAGDSLSHTLTTMTDAYRTQIGDESAITGNACNFTGGAGAANACLTGQFIEGVRRLAGKTVIVSFYALAAASSPKLGVSLDQYFGSGGSPSATVSGTGQSVTVSSATWARYSVTLTLPSVSGKTLGTAGNDQTSLLFWHSAGANNATRSGNVGVQSGTHIIWGCQLEIAAPGQTQPTPLEKLDPRIELSNCQRFYQQWMCGVTSSLANGYFLSPFAVPMRATPTLTVGSITTGSGATFAAYGQSVYQNFANSAAALATGYASADL